MASIINTNIASLNAQRSLSNSQSQLNVSLQRLSSGLRVNSAKDDAAGLSIATRMDSNIRGMNVAVRNANDGISLAQTADGALSKMTDSLQRMRELAVQSANGTNDQKDRSNLDTEFKQLQAEIVRLGETKFNGNNVFGEAFAGANFTIQVGSGASSGSNDTTGNTIAVTGRDMAATMLAAHTTASIYDTGDTSETSMTAATTALGQIDTALESINTSRANFGAVQNRFESVIGNLQVSIESQSAAKSRIMDTDFAAETANLTRGQILQQAGTAMLAQANSLPNGVLSLLRG